VIFEWFAEATLGRGRVGGTGVKEVLDLGAGDCSPLLSAQGSGAAQMSKKLHVVAGIPGTRVQKSLDSFVQYVADRHESPVSWVSVDEELRRAAEPYVQKFFGMPGSSLGPLLLPRPFLRQIWRKAFDAVWQRVERALESQNVILTLHLCYFLHYTREFFVPLDVDVLKQKISKRATAVITLIDDIYDCHQQLFAVGGRFNPPESPEAAVLALLMVLDWRSTEILLADSLAAACQRPHFVFGVKHTFETFFDLLYADKRKVYLSHPISEPRRTLRNGDANSAREVVTEINQALSRLQSEVLVFEPTAIDELRFRPSDQDRRKPSGNLEPRWPFARDGRRMLYTPPEHSKNSFAFPVGWEEDRRAEIGHSSLLSELFEAVSSQINARDHALVEQSQLLACYRPLFMGNASSGVTEELLHMRRLIDPDVRRREDIGIVFSPESDRDDYPSRQLLKKFAAWRDDGLVAGDKGDFDRLLSDLREPGKVKERTVLLEQGDSRALMAMCSRYNLTIASKSGGRLPDGTLGTTSEAHRDQNAGQLAAGVLELKRTYLDDLADDGFVKMFNNETAFFKALGC